MAPIVCLLTDFGDSDAYAASMKGVLLSLCPELNLIDITHQIAPQNVLSASYLLYSAWDYFPEATVFICVVDPGVGSERKEIICRLEDKYVVCPDNGTISLLMRMKKQLSCFVLQREAIENIMDRKISSTFHGRDIFAPAAALICNQKQAELMHRQTDPLLIPHVHTENDKKNQLLKGKILHIDGFGNCISAIHKSQLTQPFSRPVELKSQKIKINVINNTFSDVVPGRPVAYWGSMDFLEIGVRNGNASLTLGISQTDEVALSL
ncbi:MAG: SAM-dependent chlorinase/fluorinase [Spirochaetales bacterium]|nr:SAM-dependent chlorinase/fluorinase [Spirochaetales bacterium]